MLENYSWFKCDIYEVRCVFNEINICSDFVIGISACQNVINSLSSDFRDRISTNEKKKREKEKKNSTEHSSK